MIKKKKKRGGRSSLEWVPGCEVGCPGPTRPQAVPEDRSAQGARSEPSAPVWVSAGYMHAGKAESCRNSGDPPFSQAKWVCRRQMKKEII